MGAGLAVSFLAYQRKIAEAQHEPAFKCAIFISGGQVYDGAAVSRGEIRKLNAGAGDEIIDLPTSNIWGCNDMLWPGLSVQLANMCRRQDRTEYVCTSRWA